MYKISLLLALTVVAFLGCDSGGACEIEGNWSTADTGPGSCQVNLFGDTDYAVYCLGNATGGSDCACGAAVDNPLTFTSTDFCDLSGSERACEAIELCNFPL